MDYLLRKARLDDADAICQLNREEMGYDVPIEQTRKSLSKLLASPKDIILVAEAASRVIGYVHANDYDLLYAPHLKNIMGISVESCYKRCGIGRALLEGIETWAKTTGACGVRLVSGATRTGAHAFYRSCGYSGEKQQLNFKKYFS